MMQYLDHRDCSDCLVCLAASIAFQISHMCSVPVIPSFANFTERPINVSSIVDVFDKLPRNILLN